MIPPSTLELIAVDELLEKTRRLHDDGYRLVQIGAARLPECMELTYSFDREGRLAHLRLRLPLSADETGPRVPSISSIYYCAVLYENEMHDLFNVQVQGMAVDFHGNLYRTAIKHSFANAAPPAPKTAAAVADNPGQAK